MWERHCFKWCDNSTSVKKWSSEEVVVPYLYEVDKKVHRYYVDLKIVFENKKTLLVEIKPQNQTVPPKGKRKTKRFLNEAYNYVKNVNKWSAAKEYAEDRGWAFEIWTEKELTEMGILPKRYPKSKKLPPKKKKSSTKANK